MDRDLIFVKFGGSLITDKTRAESARYDVLARLADEVQQALVARPDLSLLLGHGSGSFGHWVASQYDTRKGVRGREAWIGFARVAAAAARLNHIVIDALLEAGVPVLGMRPSASARCQDGVLMRMDTLLIRRALEEKLVPLVHGDVALDEVRGGTIISTEEIMAFLARTFYPQRILLLGETPGVLEVGAPPGRSEGAVIPYIRPDNIQRIVGSLGGARGRDVTGGMLAKVHQMLDLVQSQPGLRVYILSGLEPGLLIRALLEDDLSFGTCIAA